jgi:hypothetical protein
MNFMAAYSHAAVAGSAGVNADALSPRSRRTGCGRTAFSFEPASHSHERRRPVFRRSPEQPLRQLARAHEFHARQSDGGPPA